ncbi:hypothetical protein HD806DRAFT_235133 [Xylariaceae sp. AK1471]|nr:hypothetical protein HD806DRAFT_235133 [Xylariaceae sp. AK1471]
MLVVYRLFASSRAVVRQTLNSAFSSFGIGVVVALANSARSTYGSAAGKRQSRLARLFLSIIVLLRCPAATVPLGPL